MARASRHVHKDHDDIDGCACDIELKKGEETGDSDLPPAFGGVAAAALADDDESDGCDVDFTKGTKTGDADLPEARGGVQ